MELLIVKAGNDYIRFKENDIIRCNLDKASVFPLEKLDQVRHHIQQLKSNGFEDVSVSKLILTEEPFSVET